MTKQLEISGTKQVKNADIESARGMQYGIDHANKHGKPIEYRQLGEHRGVPRINLYTANWGA